MSPTVPPTSVMTTSTSSVADATDAPLDLVGDVGDDLDGAAEVVTAALGGQHGLVDRAGRGVGAAGEVLVDEALVVAEVEVGLAAVVGDEHLAVLEGVHRAGVDVDVRVELLDGDPEPPELQQPTERRRGDPLAEGADHAPGHEDVLRHDLLRGRSAVFSATLSTMRASRQTIARRDHSLPRRPRGCRGRRPACRQVTLQRGRAPRRSSQRSGGVRPITSLKLTASLARLSAASTTTATHHAPGPVVATRPRPAPGAEDVGAGVAEHAALPQVGPQHPDAGATHQRRSGELGCEVRGHGQHHEGEEADLPDAARAPGRGGCRGWRPGPRPGRRRPGRAGSPRPTARPTTTATSPPPTSLSSPVVSSPWRERADVAAEAASRPSSPRGRRGARTARSRRRASAAEVIERPIVGPSSDHSTTRL